MINISPVPRSKHTACGPRRVCHTLRNMSFLDSAALLGAGIDEALA